MVPGVPADIGHVPVGRGSHAGARRGGDVDAIVEPAAGGMPAVGLAHGLTAVALRDATARGPQEASCRMTRGSLGGPLLGEREHDADLAAQHGLGTLTGLPPGLDPGRAGAIGTGLLGPAKPVDAPLQPTGPYLRALGPGMQGVHMAAQTWPIGPLPPGRAGVDAQFAVADRAGFSEAIPDALQPLAGGVATGDAPLQASRRQLGNAGCGGRGVARGG